MLTIFFYRADSVILTLYHKILSSSVRIPSLVKPLDFSQCGGQQLAMHWASIRPTLIRCSTDVLSGLYRFEIQLGLIDVVRPSGKNGE
jgi:hypothetical protein